MADYMGMFAIACMGCEKMVKQFEDLNDDYSKIMVQVKIVLSSILLSSLCLAVLSQDLEPQNLKPDLCKYIHTVPPSSLVTYSFFKVTTIWLEYHSPSRCWWLELF